MALQESEKRLRFHLNGTNLENENIYQLLEKKKQEHIEHGNLLNKISRLIKGFQVRSSLRN